MECIFCKKTIKTELTTGIVACKNCGTRQLIKGDKTVSMNEVENEMEYGISRSELLEKANRLVRDIKDVKQKKKDFNSSCNDQIKDLEAELDDTLALLDKLDSEAAQ